MHDVATLAGVSIKTASNVVDDHSRARESTLNNNVRKHGDGNRAEAHPAFSQPGGCQGPGFGHDLVS